MQKSFTYQIDEKEYEVEVIYKKKKNITYYFRNGKFIVTTPLFVSLARIKQGLDKYGKNLIKRVESKNTVDDSKLYLFGEEVIFDEIKKEATFQGDIIHFESKEELINKLKDLYKTVMVERTRYYENIMNVEPPYKIKIKSMKSRFGSNSKITHTISYADSLYPFSIDILDSLVVHELAHHFAFDHSKNFYSIVLKYCPNYHKDNKKLKKRIYR